jgi:di/tricarboxylate transporter
MFYFFLVWMGVISYPSKLMTLEIGMVLGILACAVFLFVANKFATDVVALLMLLALVLTKTLSPADALAGFGNSAVVTIGAIFIITAGLANTGIASWLGRRILRLAGSSERRLVSLAMASAAALSLVMNNIASVAVLMPSLVGIAKQTRISTSRLLIPLSFGSLLGGTATLFTTVNILVNNSLLRRGLTPFSMWDYLRIGSILTVTGIIFMATLGRRLLPNYPIDSLFPARRLPGDLAKTYKVSEEIFEARIVEGSPLDGRSIAQTRLGYAHNLNVIGFIRNGRVKLSPDKEEIIRAGDILVIEGNVELLRLNQEALGLERQNDPNAPVVELANRDVGITEIVVSPYAGIAGQSLKDIHFREKYGLSVLALRKEGMPIRLGISDLSLHFGDALLVQGPRQRLKLLREERDFIFLEEPETVEEIKRPEKAPWALLGTTLMVVLASFGLQPIAMASLLGAMVIILSGSLKAEEGYRAVEWRAVILVAAMLSMGTAMDRSGAAAFLSSSLLETLGTLGPLAVLAGFFLLSASLAQILSGTATAVLIAPIAFSAASQLAVSPYPLLMGVVLGSSCAFLTPISHPANILVMGPGGYKFTDFARVGILLTVAIFILAVILIPRLWPF